MGCHIAPLTPADLPELAALLHAQRPEHLRFFHPFAFDQTSLQDVLGKAVRDRFWALRSAGRLAGFFMLRGWDAGYERPAFGVFVGEAFGGQGLGRAALEYSEQWCCTHDVPGLMLTVGADNIRARRLYEAVGFRPTGEHTPTGEEIHVKELGGGAN